MFQYNKVEKIQPQEPPCQIFLLIITYKKVSSIKNNSY